MEIAQHYWDRASLLNDRLNAFSWIDPTFLDRVAQKGVAQRGSDWLPIGIKDVQAVAGQPNTKSSLLVSDTPMTESSLFIDRVLSAGFIAMGRTASSELAAALTHRWNRTPLRRDATGFW